MADKVKKADVIRKGLADHPDKTPMELAALLNEENKKEKWGLKEIKPVEISGYKSRMKAAGSGGTAPKKAASSAAEMDGAPSAVKAAKEVKELVDKYGAETVAGLAGLFGRE